jgi:hypothetical protein
VVEFRPIPWGFLWGSVLGLAPATEAAMAPYSIVRGKVLSFDERKVRLKVGAGSLFVSRDSIDEKTLKLGAEVESILPAPESFPESEPKK